MKPYARGYIEITNVCGLACHFCPPATRGNKKMSDELFSQAITQVAPLVNEVCFHVMGDPLAHPHLLHFLDLAHACEVKVVLTTAGHLLTLEKYEILTHPAVKQVNFSLSSFEANNQVKSLTEYLLGLNHFVTYALCHQPLLYINWRLWNQGEISSVSFNDEIFRFVRDHYGMNVTHEKKSFPVQGRFYLHFEKRFSWPSLEKEPFQTEGFCHGLKNQFGILADGSVVPCCLDGSGAITLGNIQTTSLNEILSSPRAKAIKEGFAKKTLVEPLCRTCGYIQRFS